MSINLIFAFFMCGWVMVGVGVFFMLCAIKELVALP